MIVSLILNIVLIAVLVWYFIAQRKENKRNSEQEIKHQKEIKDKISYFINQAKSAETLRDLYLVHIRAWASGIRNKNLGPDEYGMFRTKDILMMNPNEVFLGNVWGLWTKPLTYWENATREDRKIVTEQYRSHLISNMHL